MTDHANETRRRRRQEPAGAPPNSSDVVWEIFLRLPPLPSSLPRVSLVCKWWRRLAANPKFLLRFRAHHRKAPLLGLFKEYGGWVSFTPILNAPDCIPRQRFSMRIDYGGSTETYPYHGTLLGCRHGRVLVHDPMRREALVCDPITGEQCRIALPPEFGTLATARGSVLCANGQERHVHGGCHSSPFKIVLVKILYEAGDEHRARGGARVYSSETGTWSDLILGVEPSRSNLLYLELPSTLVGGWLYWWLSSSYCNKMNILGFNICNETLSVIEGPPVQKLDIYCSQIIHGEDGDVGVAVLSYPTLQLWDLKVRGGDDVATWFLWKTITLNLVPNMRATETEIVGYVEEDDAILIKFNKNVFIVQLVSAQSKKLCESFVTHRYHPFTSFYSSGKFGRCKGITSAPRIAPAIEPSQHEDK